MDFSFPIRSAIPEDALGICTVQYRGWQDTYRGIIPDSHLDEMSIEKGFERWKKNLSIENPQRIIDVLLNEKNEIIGYVSGGVNRAMEFKADSEIYALYLFKQYHGNGLGKKLFIHVIQRFKEMQFKSFCVFVLTKNPAIDFYRRFKPDMEHFEKIKIGELECDETGLGWSDMDKFFLSL